MHDDFRPAIGELARVSRPVRSMLSSASRRLRLGQAGRELTLG